MCRQYAWILEGVSLISAGMASKVLVCFGDTYCKLHELADADQKANVALFGDGAGVILLEKDTTAPDILLTMKHTASLIRQFMILSIQKDLND